jgi:hypothetical protein
VSNKHKTSPHWTALVENSLRFKYSITIVNSVSVIKVKTNGLSYTDFFFCTTWAHVTEVRLEKMPLGNKKQLGGLQFVL